MYSCSSSTLQCNVYSYFIILTEELFRVFFFLSHLIRSGDLFAIDLHSSSQGVCLAFELLLENYSPFFSKLFFYTTTFEKKSKGIVIITIKQSSKILKFMAHIIWPD